MSALIGKIGERIKRTAPIPKAPGLTGSGSVERAAAQADLIQADAISRKLAQGHHKAHIRTNGPIGGSLKRSFDIVIALGAIVATLPVMIVIVLLFSLEGAPIYAHKRVGYGGRAFRCYKFRTMVRDGDSALEALLESDPSLAEQWKSHRKIPGDPRVTPVGRFLRKSSLDELPQLFNVLRGDMSCVGPRPVTFEELRDYGASRAKYTSVRPGLTGLWQVSGRNEVSFDQRVRIDTSYIDAWSLWLDVWILMRTPFALLRFNSTH